jgi:hypothetical protein
MPLIDYSKYIASPVMRTYQANKFVDGMSEEEKKESWRDDNIFGDKSNLKFSKNEALGLGRGIFDSLGMFMNDRKTNNINKEFQAKQSANNYTVLPEDTYAYNAFSVNPYNKSYFQDGGEIENNEDYFNTSDVYSPFDVTENEDEIALTFINSLFDDEDDYRQSNYDYRDMDYDTVTPSYNSYNQNTASNIFPIVDHIKSLGIKPSSVNDGQHNKNSKHYASKAFDLGVNTSFGGDPNKMEDFINYYNNTLKRQYPNLKMIDERKHPSGQKVWSGSHLHFEID